MLYAARDLFNTIEMPALMHCKSGADRAGLMAALYLLIHRKRPVAEAMQQLSFRYLHVRQAKTGMLDSFFEAYAPYVKPKAWPFSTGWIMCMIPNACMMILWHVPGQKSW